MSRTPQRPACEIVVRVLDWEGVTLTPLAAAMPDVTTALRHAALSGYAPAQIPSFPNGVRLGRVWIEDRRYPATARRDYERHYHKACAERTS